MDIIPIAYLIVLCVSIFSLVVTISNLLFFDNLDSTIDIINKPLVSILVPARNEESGIRTCISSLINQDYDNLEILVLDDNSSDMTAEIIQSLSGSNNRLKLIHGSPLPPGWIGKNWACQQLTSVAAGDLLIFIDADTILSRNTVSKAVIEYTRRGADLLTIMPKRTSDSVTEKLLFNFMDWATFCWIPIRFAQNIKFPHISATFGQFMLFKKESYMSIGGHSAIRDNPLDDFELGRMTKRSGLKWILFTGSHHVQVMPYKNNREAFQGISRSIFPALDYRVSILVGLSTGIMLVGFLPLATLTLGLLYIDYDKLIIFLAATSLLFFSIPWITICRKFEHKIFLAALYPISISLMVIVAFHSLFTYSFGSTNWKEREITKHKINF